MKKNLIIAFALLAFVVAGAAFAAAYAGTFAFGGPQPLPIYAKGGLFIGTGSPADTENRLTKSFGKSATIDFTSTTVGCTDSSAITITGAVAGDSCEVGVPTAAAALAAEFTCYVTATDTAKVRFCPKSQQRGAATLVSASPSQVVVAGITALSVCTATPVGLTAAIAAGGIAVSLTTTNLTLTGPNTVTTVINYDCWAPVDPASGTYRVRVTSAQ